MRADAARVMADMIALRTAAIDTAVRDAIAAGAKQLVVLGAGYDGRAWRMPELTGVKVFEVDHPATQGFKRARLSELPPSKGIVTFVSMNFETESLDADLLDLGRCRDVPASRRDAGHPGEYRGQERARINVDRELSHDSSRVRRSADLPTDR